MRLNHAFIVFLSLFVFASSALAVDYRMAPEFKMIQQMQGAWQRHCYASLDGSSKVYREDALKVDFTHLHFSSKIYLDINCTAMKTQYSTAYRYLLTGEFAQAGEYEVFSLNAVAEVNQDFFQFPQLNIVSSNPGKLYFGRDFSGESQAGMRLTRLETSNPFIRH